MKLRPGIVNGDIISDLVKLCNDNFLNPMIQSRAGARLECMYCGAMERDDGSVDHSASECPVVKYAEIAEKHATICLNNSSVHRT